MKISKEVYLFRYLPNVLVKNAEPLFSIPIWSDLNNLVKRPYLMGPFFLISILPPRPSLNAVVHSRPWMTRALNHCHCSCMSPRPWGKKEKFCIKNDLLLALLLACFSGTVDISLPPRSATGKHEKMDSSTLKKYIYGVLGTSLQRSSA